MELICPHVDDMLGTGNEKFQVQMKELKQLVGFGSMKRQMFDHCGRQCEKIRQWWDHDLDEVVHPELEKRKSGSRAHETVG